MTPQSCRLSPCTTAVAFVHKHQANSTVIQQPLAAIPGGTTVRAFEQAVTLHDQGRLLEAEQLYTIVLKANKSHFGALVRLGIIRLQQGRFEDAARLLRRSLKVDRNSADAYHSLGCALTGLGRSEEAIRQYRRALELRPKFPEVQNNLGLALQMLGRFQEAIVQYEKALMINPTYPEARNNIGNALHQLGRSEEAIGHYEQALAMRPGYAEARWNVGTALRALGRYEEAVSQYEKALAIKPNYAEAHNSLGNALDMVNRSEDAVACYKRALVIRPDYADAHFNLAVTLAARGRQEEAIAHYHRALAIVPDYVESLRKRDDAFIVLLGLVNLPASVISMDTLLAQLDDLVRRKASDNAEFKNLAAFVRATLLDKLSRHSEAWEHFRSANRTMFLANQEGLRSLMGRQHASLARLREKSINVTDANANGREPISLFILGPSRSGKTTLERLVGMLDGVKLGYENRVVETAVRKTLQAAGLPATGLFETLPPTLYPLCRAMYDEDVFQRVGSARVFTSTNPSRIHDADLLATAFPGVRFLCVKRDPEDNILRIYMRRYKNGNIYSYDLRAARDHIAWYHEMVDSLAQKLPDAVRVIRYEDMIADPAAALRVAADLCGLPLRPAGPLSITGDDRGCARPYRQFMASAIEE
jgi:tetratricopeptide (TPR) repeat protein